MSTEFFNDQWRIPSNENQNKVSNYSMQFNGSSDKIEVQDAGNEFGFSNNRFSLSAWVFIDSNTTQNGLIAKRNIGTAAANKMWYFEINTSSQLRFLWYNTAGGSGNASSTDTIPLNTWTHVVVTSDGTGANGLNFYINGSVDSGGSKTGPSSASSIQQTGTPLWVGARGGNSSAQYTSGKIDQVTVFDYELSQDQVEILGGDGYVFNFIPNDYINFGNFSSLSGATSVTVSFWYNKTRIENEIIFDFIEMPYSSSGGRIGMQIHPNGSYVYINGKNYNHPSTAGIGEWGNFVLVFNGAGATNEDKLKIYLDGAELTGGTYSGTIDNAIGPFTSSMNSILGQIGTLGSSTKSFRGELSNVAIFNSNLSDSEIATLYNSGKPGDILSLNPLAWYKLDETAIFNANTSVWSVPDASSNSNTGTSVGMNASSLVVSNINGELIANPMATNPKPIAYYQLGDQSVDNGANLLVPNNSLSDYVFDFTPNDHITIANSTDFNFGTGDFTISFWVKFDNFTPYQYLFDFRDSNLTSENVLIMYMKPTANRIVVAGGGFAALSGNSGTVLTTGVWNNIIVKRTNTQVTSHINGATADQTSGVFGIDFNTTPKLNIGARGDGVAGLNGRMSNFQIFNTALPQTGSNSIETIYNNGSPLTSMSGFTSLVSWYKLNAAEIFNSTSTEWSVDNNAYPSVYASSLNFDGTNDYINCGDADNLSFGNGATDSPFSVSSWVYFDDVSSNAGIITKFGSATSVQEWMMYIASTPNIRFLIKDASSGDSCFVLGGTTLKTGQWYHFLATYNGVGGSSAGNGIKIYLNGNEETLTVSNNALYVAMENTTQPVEIGRYSTNYFNGLISNGSIFTTELTSSEVTTIYNNGRPETSLSNSPLSWWKLNNTSSGLLDSGSASNNGTNNGATEYAGFVNSLAGESFSMDSSNLVVSDLQQTSGYSPYALDFDGVNDYLDCGDSNTFSFGNSTIDSPFSISAWINMDDATKFRIASKQGANGVEYFLTNGGDDKLNFILYDTFGNGNIRAKYDTALTSYEGQWIHIVGTYSGVNRQNGVELYLNGSLLTTLKVLNPPYTAMGNTTQPFEIAKASTGYANGKISNVSVFNTELTSTQVTEIYNSGIPSDLNTFSGTAPVAWWQLGSNSSFNTNWTCLDEIGSNNAVSVNMTNSDIVDGPGYSASGLGTSSIDVKGDAPYSTANGLSENMDVLDRVTDVPS